MVFTQQQQCIQRALFKNDDDDGLKTCATKSQRKSMATATALFKHGTHAPNDESIAQKSLCAQIVRFYRHKHKTGDRNNGKH